MSTKPGDRVVAGELGHRSQGPPPQADVQPERYVVLWNIIRRVNGGMLGWGPSTRLSGAVVLRRIRRRRLATNLTLQFEGRCFTAGRQTRSDMRMYMTGLYPGHTGIDVKQLPLWSRQLLI